MQYSYIITYRISCTPDASAREKRLNDILEVIQSNSDVAEAYKKDDTTSTIYAYSKLDAPSLKSAIEPKTIQEDSLTLIQICRAVGCKGKVNGVATIHTSLDPEEIQRRLCE